MTKTTSRKKKSEREHGTTESLSNYAQSNKLKSSSISHRKQLKYVKTNLQSHHVRSP